MSTQTVRPVRPTTRMARPSTRVRAAQRCPGSGLLPAADRPVARIAEAAQVSAPGNAALAPARLVDSAGVDAASQRALASVARPAVAARAQVLSSVAAWRRADTWREAAAPVPSWALSSPVAAGFAVAPSAAALGAAEASEDADEAEERGLGLAMAGLVTGGLIATLFEHAAASLGGSAPLGDVTALSEVTALGCVLGLVAGAAMGWHTPIPALWQALSRAMVQRA